MSSPNINLKKNRMGEHNLIGYSRNQNIPHDKPQTSQAITAKSRQGQTKYTLNGLLNTGSK